VTSDAAPQDGNASSIDTGTSDAATAGDTSRAEIAAETSEPLPTKGNAVAPGQGLPEMTQVVDSDGQPVGPDNLVGTWTVMWFYPAAQTAG
jgi:hypothetical protein